MGPLEREAFDRDWASWAHDGQLRPDGAWRTWVIKAGRGFGKTLSGSNWVTAAIATRAKLHIALVGATLEDARRVMVEGRSGLLAVAADWIDGWHPSLHRLTFRTGAVATLFSGATPHLLRGPEHHLAWCDELAKWEKPQETWDMLQLGLRLGDWPRALVTTTPRPGPVLTGIMAGPDTIVTGGPTSANPHNPPVWTRAMYARLAGTRLGRQELEAEIISDHPGALWTVELLERCRRKSSPSLLGEGDHAQHGGGAPLRQPFGLPPPRDELGEDLIPDQSTTLIRVVIGVDPPAADGTCGIIACAKDSDGRGHVLADHSVTARSPEGWARSVAQAAQIHSSPSLLGEGDHLKGGGGAAPPRACLGEGDHAKHGGGVTSPLPVLVVVEKNQGGRMVEAILRTADPTLRVKSVTATLSKSERAEPVAHLFEAGRVTLHGRFPELEAELCGLIAGGGYEGPGTSPDRADAMVWGLTELLLAAERAPPRIRVL